MATSLNFKDVIDLPQWRPIANTPTTNAAGMYTAYDLRNSEDRDPFVYYLTANTTMSAYNFKNDEWTTFASPALTGTFGIGAAAILHPSIGPRGTLAAGWTTATHPTLGTVSQGGLTTALPASVGVNQLANRGDGRGYKIRIIGNHAAGSGKTEEAIIVGNTSGTTPTLTLDRQLSFTPASGDGYELISGRVYLLGAGTLAAGMWKFFDIATNSYSSNQATTNLPATVGTDSALIALSELHVPYTRNPGEGFLIGAGTYSNSTSSPAALGCLTATASAGTTLTGQASAGDAGVATNEYRNFQIRIVEDTGTPTAVGQRRNITSHTAGASPVYTVATWTVTPSATTKYVIENNDDRILLRSSASTNMFNYSISGNAWDSATTWAAGGSASGAGCKMEQAFGIVPDANKNVKPGMIYVLRGAAATTLDVLDITAAATGTWTAAVVYGHLTPTFTTGTSAAYDPVTNQGRYWYLNQSGTQRNYRLDLQNRTLEPWAFLRYSQGTVTIGEKSACMAFIDGSTKVSFWLQLRHTDSIGWQVLISR